MSNPKDRVLMPTENVRGVVIAGPCSICHRPFESQFTVPELARRELAGKFAEHVCDEDFSQAAARIVRESTDKV